MKFQHATRWAAAAVVAATIGWFAHNATTAAANRDLPEPTIAMVEISTLFENLDERTAREKELEAFIQERSQKVQELGRQFENEQAAFEALPPQSDARRQKAEELERLRFQVRFERELSDTLIDRKRGEVFGEIFQKISDATSELARQRGYTLVLTDDQGAFPPAFPSESQARAAIFGRRVLYADDAIDITDELVQYMNNQWQAGQGD